MHPFLDLERSEPTAAETGNRLLGEWVPGTLGRESSCSGLSTNLQCTLGLRIVDQTSRMQVSRGTLIALLTRRFRVLSVKLRQSVWKEVQLVDAGRGKPYGR